jgi:hypothetical protein
VRVRLARTGGFGGLRQTVALDADRLSAGEQAELRRLLDAAGFWAAPARIVAPAAAPDRLRYRLAVEDGGRRHEVLAAEEAAPAALLAVIRWVEERGGK